MADEGNEGVRNLREALGNETERADSEKERADGLQRELTFMRAGVDTSSALGTMFAKAYDGDLEADAVKAAWAQVAPPAAAPGSPPPTGQGTSQSHSNGVGTAVPQAPQGLTPEQAAQWQAAQQINAGTPPPPEGDGYDFEKLIADGKIRTPEDIARVLEEHGEPVAYAGPVTDQEETNPFGGSILRPG